MTDGKDPGGDKWKKLPKGWTDASRKKFWDSLTSRAPKHKVSQCIKRMDGKVDDPGAFCAALADRVIGKGWRTEAAKERAKKAADMKDPFDLLLELDQAQPSEEEQRQYAIDSAIEDGAGDAFYALARSGASVDPAKRNPAAKGLRSSFGGWWPARKEIKPGLKEMAFRELISDHEWRNLQQYGVRSPKDLPKDTPVRVFFDTEYRDTDGVVSRWYTGYGYATAGGRKKYLAKKDMKSYRDVLDGLRKYLAKVQKEYKGRMSKMGSSQPLRTRRDYGSDEMLDVEEVSKLCPPCGEKMKSAGIKGIRRSVLRTAMMQHQKKAAQSKKAAGVSLGYLYSEAQKQFSSVVSKDLVAFYKSFSKSVVAVSLGSKGATVSFANPSAGPIWGLYEYNVTYFYPRKKDSLMVEITKDGRKVHTGEIKDVSLMNSEKVAQRIAVMFEKLMPKRR